MGTISTARQPAGEDEAEAYDAASGILSQRLMDSLLHDVRNPLNALSINLDVLVEKLRREQGEIPATQEKNLRVMRDQIFRIDALLKHFAEYMGPERGAASSQVDLSEVLGGVVDLLGHETRRHMIKVRQMVEPGLFVRGSLRDVRFVVLQALYRGVSRAGSEGELDVTLQRDGGRALLKVKDGQPDPLLEPFAHAHAGLAAAASRLGADIRTAGNETLISLPLE